MIGYLRVFAPIFAVCVVFVFATDARAVPVIAEPDDFALGADLTNSFAGATLSVQGKPASVVQSVDGFSVFNARNLATTGTRVFGQSPPHSVGVPQGWDELNGLLRIDFAAPTDLVAIDLLFDDNDSGFIRAFNSSGILLATATGSGDGRGPTPFVRVGLSRTVADISFITAGGDSGEALFLDNLEFNNLAVPEPATIALFCSGLLVLFAVAVNRENGRRST